MADNQETPDVSARDIAELLHRFDVTLAEQGKRLEALTAQAIANGSGLSVLKREAITHAEQLGAVCGRLDTQGDALVQVHKMITTVHNVVSEAAPLLQSRAAKALKAGGTVLDHLRAGRPRG